MPRKMNIPRWGGPEGEERKGTPPKLRLFLTLVPAVLRSWLEAARGSGTPENRSRGGGKGKICSKSVPGPLPGSIRRSFSPRIDFSKSRGPKTASRDLELG